MAPFVATGIAGQILCTHKAATKSKAPPPRAEDERGMADRVYPGAVRQQLV